MIDINENRFIAHDAITVIDQDFKITIFNEEAQRVTGFSNEEMVTKHCRFLFKNWDREVPYLKNVLFNNKAYQRMSFVIISADEKTINVLGSLTPMCHPDGQKSCAIFVFHNPDKIISLRDSIEEQSRELLDERNKLNAIFNSRMEGTFTVDKECIITTFNRSAERITGYRPEEAIGSKCWEIFNSDYCDNECPYRKGEIPASYKTLTSMKELYITRKDGHKAPVRVSSAPLFNSDDERIGMVETFIDISELINLSSHLDNRFKFPHIIGRSKSMDKVYRLMDNVSRSNSNVLVTGESGTGKELVARAIHLNSNRRKGPFIALNCSAFVETLLESELFGHERGAFTGAVQTKHGRFELAQGGTLFLDEIGDISLPIQVKLLRVLETRKFERVGGIKTFEMDVRLIAATNKNMVAEMHTGRFREDFYYRINVINIHLPPLRERMDDLPLLLQNIIERNSTRFSKHIKGLSPQALTTLMSYNWPGNIRELENIVEYAFVMCQGEIIETEHLPENLWNTSLQTDTNGFQRILTFKQTEESLITSALDKYQGHRGKTAEALGIDRATLWRKMKKYDLL
ncbi:MAG: sigma 54-interacting transcriptional regulator [Candidatus Hatepunaea meridiana]|nr:sigma 54-interacting transcriptional regulator [Candidatus Hatepunaea meridiana]